MRVDQMRETADEVQFVLAPFVGVVGRRRSAEEIEHADEGVAFALGCCGSSHETIQRGLGLLTNPRRQVIARDPLSNVMQRECVPDRGLVAGCRHGGVKLFKLLHERLTLVLTRIRIVNISHEILLSTTDAWERASRSSRQPRAAADPYSP